MLSYSFFSSLHCAFMCGPMVCAFLGPNSRIQDRSLWYYNISRFLSYVLIGAVLGAISHTLSTHLPKIGATLAVFLGVILFLLAIQQLSGKKFSAKFPFLEKIISAPTSAIRGVLIRAPKNWRPVLLGFMTGLLPCMSLTPAFTMAAGSNSSFNGAITMAGFGLGTMPVMFLTPAMSQQLLSAIPLKVGAIVAACFLFIAGGITILRAF